MTTTTKLPVTDDWAAGPRDTLAAERARRELAELAYRLADTVTEWKHDAEDIGQRVAAEFAGAHAVQWEYALNEHGVRVRRYVARSAWEVDPQAVRP